MKVFDLRYWRWMAMIFVATAVVACSEDDYDYNPAPADKTIPDVRPDGVPLVHTKAVRELMRICSEHHEVKHLLEKAIAKAASINPDKKYNPAQTLEEFYTFVDMSFSIIFPALFKDFFYLAFILIAFHAHEFVNCYMEIICNSR